MGKNKIDNTISAVIPAYNAEDTIERALDSIKNQTRLDLVKEIIVVNDGSNDRTLSVVENFKKNNEFLNIIIITQENAGVSTARNVGIRVATGTWIALLDSDDEWFSDKIEKQFLIIEKHPDIMLLGGDFREKSVSILGRKIKNLYKATVKDICIVNFPQPSTAIFRKKIFNEIGGYDETRRFAEDGQYFLKICHLYNCYYQPGQVVYYDRGKRGFGSSGLSANLKEMYLGNLQNFKELYEEKIISRGFYYFIKTYSVIKYFRRVMLCQIEQLKNS